MASSVSIILLAGGLAAVHVLVGKLRFIRELPRSRYLSLAGGVSVAYVFVHLLPEITERQAAMAGEAEPANTFLGAASEQTLFLVALLGFALFYGLERLAAQSRREAGRQEVALGTETRTSILVFWLHIASFAVYNALIGYFLLHREQTGAVSLLLYFTAMALHFIVNDHGLREHHRDAYNHFGRWILASGVLVGALIGVLAGVPETVLSLLLGFLAGGIILNVIKEELPEERESSFWAFAIGLTSYTVILLRI